MFTRLLVPLDGSGFAETAFPAAAHLAERMSASVTLLHVVEQHAPEAIHGQRHLSNLREAQFYLDEAAGRAFPAAIRVHRQVLAVGSAGVAHSIQEYASSMSADLIVMCKHGRSGLRHLIMGSNAQQVVRFGTIPVLQVRPAESGAVLPFKCSRILVPLDGSATHERALEVAVELAKACGAEIHLLQVIPTLQTLSGERAAAARLMPAAVTALLDMDSQKAKEYLRDKSLSPQCRGIPVSITTRRGEPAEVILQIAHEMAADLIVVATHRKGGTEAFWSGSVAPKISSRSDTPVLLLPLGE